MSFVEFDRQAGHLVGQMMISFIVTSFRVIDRLRLLLQIHPANNFVVSCARVRISSGRAVYQDDTV